MSFRKTTNKEEEEKDIRFKSQPKALERKILILNTNVLYFDTRLKSIKQSRRSIRDICLLKYK